MSFVLDLRHLHLPGSGYGAFENLDAAIVMAQGFAVPGVPVRILRESIASDDLAAIVHSDGGVDHYR